MSFDEWFSMWILEVIQEGNSMETFHYQFLRKMIKTGGADVFKLFREKFKEIIIDLKILTTHLSILLTVPQLGLLCATTKFKKNMHLK